MGEPGRGSFIGREVSQDEGEASCRLEKWDVGDQDDLARGKDLKDGTFQVDLLVQTVNGLDQLVACVNGSGHLEGGQRDDRSVVPQRLELGLEEPPDRKLYRRILRKGPVIKGLIGKDKGHPGL